jgi:hypothetical protein
MTAELEMGLNPARSGTGNAKDEIVSLEARQEQLRVLVGELLRTNEELRQKVARLEAQDASPQVC